VNRLRRQTDDPFAVSIDHQTRVHEEAVAPAVARRRQAFNRATNTKINFRGVAEDQVTSRAARTVWFANAAD